LRALEKSLGGTPYSSSIARATSEVTTQAYRVSMTGVRASATWGGDENEMGREARPRPMIAGCSTKSSDGSLGYRPIAARTTAFFILSAIRSALWGDAEWFDAWIARRLALTARRID
jgi:hypothetical protein